MKNRAKGLAALFLAASAIPAAAERPVEDFTAKEIMSWAKISPDGTKLIAEMEIEGERKLAIMPLEGDGGTLTIGLGEGDLNDVAWVGNDWLVADVGRRGHYSGFEAYLSQVMAFRADGSDVTKLDTDNGGDVIWTAHDGSPRILLEYRETMYVGEQGFFPQVAMVDVSKNKFTRVAGSMEGVWDWYADTTGAVRVGVGSESRGRKTRLVYREGDSGLFKEVASASTDDWLPAPALFLRDNKALTISRHEGFAGVYEMDLETMQVGAKVFGVDGYDVSSILRDPIDPHGLRGIVWYDESRKVQWFDPRFVAAQQMLDAAFPNGRPMIESSTDDAMRHVVNVRRGDKAGYYLFDMAQKRVRPIVKNGDDDEWAPIGTYRYKARDGLEIEAFLTWPRGKERTGLPVIVMPHGGPRARDYGTWDIWAQFFADRGYLVIQPNFRGSTGYGRAFEEAGVGEWGLKMQDDVDDALAWAAGEGYADPKRACIVGGSYGGYVAERAAERNPDLYRCAISFAGVSDLKDMMSQDQQSYFSGGYARDYWKEQAADLDAVSPINHPGEFGIPILLVHGKEDQRVPVKQTRQLYDKLRAAGKDVIYIEQPEGDHHFTRDEDMHQFLLESEKFLDRYNPAD